MKRHLLHSTRLLAASSLAALSVITASALTPEEIEARRAAISTQAQETCLYLQQKIEEAIAQADAARALRMQSAGTYDTLSFPTFENTEEGEGDGGSSDYPSPDTRRNFAKFAAQAFLLIDTNDAAINDTNLYNACASFPADTNVAATLQIKGYGANAVVIKANHFDYSAETDRDFALLVCDSPERPTWKTVDLSGASDSQDGWLIQGFVSRLRVTDPMYFLVTNIAPIHSAFFRAIPYGGPQIQLTGAQANDTVSNTITLHADISDLSGTTNHQASVLANGLPPRYTLAPSNNIVIDTRYAPNGSTAVAVTVSSYDAMLYDPTNPPMDTKLDYDVSATLSLDFENETYVYFPSDMADPDIGTNYFLFGVTPPQYIAATIYNPSNGNILKTFSGYDPSFGLVELDWNFTQTNGTSPYTNDQYAVTFTASAAPNGAGTTLTVTNTISRMGVRPAGWVINSYEEVKPSSYSGNGSYINSEMKKWADTEEFMYENLYWYNFASQCQYNSLQIGSNRDNPSSVMPFALNPTTESTWRNFIYTAVTNRNYSDFNYGPGHGNGFEIGGGEYSIALLNYVNTKISANEMLTWAQTGASGTNGNKRWKMRKVAMWCCYSARVAGAQSSGAGLYGNWHNAFGINPYQMNTLSGKNCGLYFNGDLLFQPYGSFPVTDVAEVAAFFDQDWVMGATPAPGSSDPNYSIEFAFGVTAGLFPELSKAQPGLIVCPFLPYAGVYDDELMNNDFHQVKP